MPVPRITLSREAGTVRFTIVTPVFNGMPWLPESVRSVARQRSAVDVEHIVLDAGSADGSREWLTSQADGSILVFEPDAGQTDALRRGFDRATGDVLGWLNADDVLEPDALLRVADVLNAHPHAVGASGAALLVGPRGAILGAIPTPPEGSFRGLLRYPRNLAQPSTFFRREAYERAGGLDIRWHLAMDVDLWLRLTGFGDFVLMPTDALSRFRLHPGAKSVRGAADAALEDLRVRRSHGMALPSRAGIYLLKAAYYEPVRRRIRRWRA